MVLILYIILVGVFASGFYLATITKNNKMENKINIAELLKDCPKGMELDCLIYENVYFDKVSDNKNSFYPILCYITDEKNNRTSISFTKNGCESRRYGAKCVIFPKGKTTWEGFQRPFKDGDIIVTKTFYNFIFYSIYKGVENREVLTYADYTPDDNRLINVNHTLCHSCEIIEQRLATEEEKQKLFDAIKANGYKWNTETKTLEELVEPRFKVGDRVRSIYNNFQYDITELTDTHYTLVEVECKFKYTEDIIEDKNWELVPNKFDITTLVPFESRVLVRNVDGDLWKPAIYGFPHSKGCYVVGGVYWGQCIPYEENKELLGTTNNLEEYGSR